MKKCETCQQQKIIQVKTHEPVVITDTHVDTFDKVSLDTVGLLPIPLDGNRHILTIQDNINSILLDGQVLL